MNKNMARLLICPNITFWKSHLIDCWVETVNSLFRNILILLRASQDGLRYRAAAPKIGILVSPVSPGLSVDFYLCQWMVALLIYGLIADSWLGIADSRLVPPGRRKPHRRPEKFHIARHLPQIAFLLKIVNLLPRFVDLCSQMQETTLQQPPPCIISHCCTYLWICANTAIAFLIELLGSGR